MERSGKLTLSLETAKRYWKSGNKDLMEIATILYSKQELEKLTIEDIVDNVHNNYPELYDVMESTNYIYIVAEYFNKGWHKKDNEIGYFYTFDVSKGMFVLREHNTVTYPGIVYYKDKVTAIQAFEYLKEHYTTLWNQRKTF